MTLNCLTPADKMPWPRRNPFEVNPAFERLGQPSEASAAHFAVDAQLPAYQVHKHGRLSQGDGQAGHADEAALKAMASLYRIQTGLAVPADAVALTQTLAEDFVILHDESHRGFVVRYLSVCFASNWRPDQKLGLNFAQIHAPIAQNSRLLAAREGIEKIAFRQSPILRHIWLISPTASLWQNPADRVPHWKKANAQGKDDPVGLLSSLCFRVERQTTLPLPEIGRAIFFIRVLVCSLRDVLQIDKTRATMLSEALATMSPEFARYRGMQEVRRPLIAALRVFDGETASGIATRKARQ